MKFRGIWRFASTRVGMLVLCFNAIVVAQHTPYLPDQSYNPLKVNVNFIIIQRQDGSGNFQDNPADLDFLHNMINVTNSVFANLTDKNEEYYPGQNLPFLSNAKIEIVPHIIFKKDETGWNNRNDKNFAGIPFLSGWYLDSMDRQIYTDESLPKAINLYFTSDGQLHEQMVVLGTTTDYHNLVFFKQHAASEVPAVNARHGMLSKYHTMRCHIANVWLKLWWKRKVLLEPDWTMEYEVGKSIAHELGHLMGLDHTPDNQLHALMRTRFGGFRDYMSTREIAKIHQTFGLYPSLWQFVDPGVTYGSQAADWVITNDEEWKWSRRLYANVIVKSGSTLTITGEVLMPPNGSIKVDQGATLILDGAIVRHVNTSAVGSFEIPNEVAENSNNPPAPDRVLPSEQAGTVLLRGNAWIEADIIGLSGKD